MADVFKANNTDALNLTTSWVGGVVPTAADVAVWDATVTAANTVSMGASLNFGGIRIANPGGIVTINGSAGQTLTLGASGIDMSTASQNLTFGFGPTLILTTANTPLNIVTGFTCTINAVTSGAGFNWNKTGAGIAVLLGANTGMTGLFTLGAGTVRVGNNGALGGATATLALNGGALSSSSTVARTITAAGDSTIGGDVTLGDATNTGSLTFSNKFNLGGATRTLTINGTLATVVTFSGIVSNGSISRTGSSPAFFTLTGANTITSFTQGTGVLRIGNADALGGASATLALNGGTIGSASATNYTLTAAGASTIGGNITLGDSTNTGSLTFTNAFDLGAATRNITLATSRTAAFSGVISNGTLNKVGSGTLVLSGTNTYTSTLLNAGILQISNDSALGTGTVTLFGGTLSSDGASARTLTNSLSIGGNITFGDATNSGALTFSGNVSLVVGGTRTITVASPVTMSGVLSGTVGMVKAGSSSLTLSGAGANTISGASTLSVGTLILAKTGGVSPLGTAAWTISAGTTLDATVATSITNALTISGSFTFTGTANLTQSTGAITLNSSTITVSGSILQLGGAISGAAASLTKEGAGQLTLAGSSSSWGSTSGNILVNAGVLSVSNSSLALGANTVGRTITVASGATLQVIPGVSLGNIPLSIAGSGTGVGSFDAALLIGGSPTFSSITLTAAATIRGSATGTLTGAISLNGNAPTFLAAASTGLTLPSAIGDTGTALVTVGHAAATYTGTVSMTTANTFSGNVSILSGTLSAGNASALGTNTGGRTFTVASPGNLTAAVTGVNYSSVPLTINGSGVSLNGALNLANAGTTTFESITLGSAARLRGGTAGAILATAGAAGINNAGFDLTLAPLNNWSITSLIQGSGGLIISGANTVTLSNPANTFTGQVSVIGGTLAAAVLADESVASSIGAATAASGKATIMLGSTTNAGVLQYTGLGAASTNRVIDLAGTTGSATLSIAAGGGALTYNAPAFTASGAGTKTLTLSPAATSGTLTVTSVVVDNSVTNKTNMDVRGGGTVALAGLNTYSGTTGVTANSVLQFSSIADADGTPSNLGAPTTSANGTISVGGITGSGTLTYIGTGHSSNRIINLPATILTANIDASGSGTLAFSGGITATSNASSQTLALKGGGQGSISGVIQANAGAGSVILTKSGTGTWTLSGANLYEGGTTVSAGLLVAANETALGVGAVSITSSTATIQSGTSGGQNGKLTIAGNFTNSAGGTIRIGG